MIVVAIERKFQLSNNKLLYFPIQNIKNIPDHAVDCLSNILILADRENGSIKSKYV